jgi:hypothetical protein
MAEMNFNVMDGVTRVPEARYAYYPRCQVFRKGGAQCKGPAEKGTLICHAHAGQLALAVRRERERRAVLAKAVAEMRRLGKPECETADLFMDFKGIQVTAAVMAQALIDGRIDCKTAGRLVVQLQMFSKLLWQIHRKGRKDRKENRISPQVYADERRLDEPGEKPSLTTGAQRHGEQLNTKKNWAANQRDEIRIGLLAEVVAFGGIRGRPHGPPESARAA